MLSIAFWSRRAVQDAMRHRKVATFIGEKSHESHEMCGFNIVEHCPAQRKSTMMSEPPVGKYAFSFDC
jgi:hypothetical protein